MEKVIQLVNFTQRLKSKRCSSYQCVNTVEPLRLHHLSDFASTLWGGQPKYDFINSQQVLTTPHDVLVF